MQDAVSCTITSPAGATTPCGATSQVATIEVMPTGRSYSFDVAAPATPGDYKVHFERRSTLSVPSSDAAADATLSVLSEPLDFSGAPAVNPPIGTITARLAGAPDGVRWLSSVAMGTVAIMAGVALVRVGGRP